MTGLEASATLISLGKAGQLSEAAFQHIKPHLITWYALCFWHNLVSCLKAIHRQSPPFSPPPPCPFHRLGRHCSINQWASKIAHLYYHQSFLPSKALALYTQSIESDFPLDFDVSLSRLLSAWSPPRCLPVWWALTADVAWALRLLPEPLQHIQFSMFQNRGSISQERLGKE